MYVPTYYRLFAPILNINGAKWPSNDHIYDHNDQFDHIFRPFTWSFLAAPAYYLGFYQNRKYWASIWDPNNFPIGSH